MTDRKHYGWSRDAEANDTVDMGSDHRCVMAKFEIPKTKRKPSRNETPPKNLDRGVTCEDEHDLKYHDLEQEVKDAEPEKGTKEGSGSNGINHSRSSSRCDGGSGRIFGSSRWNLHHEELRGSNRSNRSTGSAGNKREGQRNSGPHTRKEDDGEA